METSPGLGTRCVNRYTIDTVDTVYPTNIVWVCLRRKMPLRILATADLHIGRRPSKLPDVENARRFSCAVAWESIVQLAIQESVDLVALAGDVVDHDNRFFEATGPLERGLARLAENGIHTYAVAGNHDYDVLPRIADTINSPHFHLLGRGGRWEEAVFAADGRPALRIHGWSFPANHFSTSPLAGDRPATEGNLPLMGLLHADLDAPNSSFAPVTANELQSQDLAIWLLGHVHSSRFIPDSSRPAMLYPGSPQAMDPSETGPHGPWLLEIYGPGRVEARQLPISKVRYDELEVDLTGVESQEQFEAHLADGTRDHLNTVAALGGPLEFLSLRVVLVGRTPLCGCVESLARSFLEQFERSAGKLTARIEKVINNTRPDVDLDELAQNHDPPGVLAQTLLRLESRQFDEDLKTLLKNARQGMLRVHRAANYARIEDDPEPDAEAAREHLLRQGMLLLETLRAQERSA